MLYIIGTTSGSHREMKKIKNIRGEASKTTSVSSDDDQDSDLLLASDSSCRKYRRPYGRKEINRLYQVVKDTLNNYKDQGNEAINSVTTFNNISFNLSSGTINPLPVVPVSL